MTVLFTAVLGALGGVLAVPRAPSAEAGSR